MKPASFVLLHVESVARSSAFYQQILSVQPVEASDTFAMFVLPGGFKIGLWDRKGVEPVSQGQTGSSEMVFSCDTDAEVDVMHDTWRGQGVRILQTPTHMDFGRTFVAADPDGHWLRVYHVADQPV